MKRFLAIAIICISISSCIKKETTFDFNKNFSYATTKETMSPVTTKSLTKVDITDQNGNEIATNVSGSVPLVVGNSTVLSARATAYNDDQYLREYFPSKAGYATMLFEDLFPSMGDYDMNDAAILFRYEFICKYDVDFEKNMVEALKIDIIPQAIGSALSPIGLAVAINCRNIIIGSIDRTSDQNLTSLFKVDKNSIEEDTPFTNQVVIPLTSDLNSHFENKLNRGMINVYQDRMQNKGEEFSVIINFDKKIGYDEFTLFKANPEKYNIDLFAIFSERGREVHMKGMTPTAKFNTQYFNKIGRNDFSTKDNFVWALMIPQQINHPTEKTNIQTAYPNFGKWVESNGVSDADWYNHGVKEHCFQMIP